MKWQFSWLEVLEPVVSEKLVPRSYEYLRQIAVVDLLARSVECNELDKVAYLESVKRICEVYPQMPQLQAVRADLAKLKRKYRSRLNSHRKQLLEQYQ